MGRMAGVVHNKHTKNLVPHVICSRRYGSNYVEVNLTEEPGGIILYVHTFRTIHLAVLMMR